MHFRVSRVAQRPAVTILMLLVLCLAFVAPLVTQQSVRAAPTAVVVNANDAGAGSLRQAIADVDADGVITFDIPGTGPHTITLTTGELTIDTNLTISGPGADLLTVSGNDSSRVLNIFDATVEISGLTISGGNSNLLRGGGIYSTGTLSITNSTISGNTVYSDLGGNGGGIYNSRGTLSIINSTISGNEAIPSAEGSDGGDGGGIYNASGMLTVINSTITGNSARSGGGIISTGDVGSVTVTNSTIVGNSASPGEGGGIFVFAGAMTLTGTIVAGSPLGGNCVIRDGGSGSIASLGYNLSTDATCNLTSTGDAQTTEALLLLGPWQYNGGPTQTHSLLAGSPAIDAIPVDDCPVDEDQRGVDRPLGAGCDIGAFEYIPAPTLTVPDEPVTVEATSATGAAVTFAVSAVDSEGNPLAVTCEVESEEVTSGDTFPLGDTTVECSATDSESRTSEGEFTITVEDTTEPGLLVPPDFTIYSADPDGAYYDFSGEVVAPDLVDPDPVIVCVPAADSLFPIGPNEVDCTATDDSDNVAMDTFVITVVDTGQLLGTLAEDVRDLDLPFWDEFGLLVLIGVADNLASDGHSSASCNFLELFSARVASLVPETINQDEADQLSGAARNIQHVLGCSPRR